MVYLDTLIYAPLLSGECARLATQMGVHAASGARNYVSIGAPMRTNIHTRDLRNVPR